VDEPTPAPRLRVVSGVFVGMGYLLDGEGVKVM
jgi:hypothetical protein